MRPQPRQWCRRRINVNARPQVRQHCALESGSHDWAAFAAGEANDVVMPYVDIEGSLVGSQTWSEGALVVLCLVGSQAHQLKSRSEISASLVGLGCKHCQAMHCEGIKEIDRTI